ncbi:hypothetical protein [Kingella potus]|uniref:hypothetical protein n=1 Tax=Kingella potus TaxID=265175 RepID=UPI000E1C1100|nr:hypothetical protein [Kingella potus]UOP00492.1 hypothetical protein LVJ84_11635 [Kingella potus]
MQAWSYAKQNSKKEGFILLKDKQGHIRVFDKNISKKEVRELKPYINEVTQSLQKVEILEQEVRKIITNKSNQ